jgi:IS4 transposase
VVVRLNWHSLPLYNQEGSQKLDVLRLVRGLKVGEVCDLPAWIRSPQGSLRAGRLIALRRNAAATRWAREKLSRKASKLQKKVSTQTWTAAQYFLIWTSLPAGTAAVEILEFYRCRWQIEPSFKRMKSILGLGHLPKKDPGSARAWLHGKLLTSLLVERIIQAADAFSPWGYRLETPPLPLA